MARERNLNLGFVHYNELGETPEDALRACVEALGGAKKIGRLLWPDKGVDAAARLLQDCVNPARNEKLSPAQILFIFRKAKQAGFHAGWEHWSNVAGYESRPVSKAEEIDRLATIVEQSTKTLAAALSALERISAQK